jgi:GH15 family glucan-1,4-alpha-glucosidase
LPAGDPRVTRTIDALERELADDGLLRRGADRDEGAFLPASFWLAECHARAGRLERAQEVFARACARASDLGLLAEIADPSTGESFGNTPLALSHVALINAADTLDGAGAHNSRHGRDSRST